MEREDKHEPCVRSNIPTIAPLHRTGGLRAANVFVLDLERFQEWDLRLRLALQGVIFCYVEQRVSLYRQHNGEQRITVQKRKSSNEAPSNRRVTCCFGKMPRATGSTGSGLR